MEMEMLLELVAIEAAAAARGAHMVLFGAVWIYDALCQLPI